MKEQNMTCYFDKAQYLLGEKIRLQLPERVDSVIISVYHLANKVACSSLMDGATLIIENLPVGGYGICVETAKGTWEGAFDVVADHRDVTRYGFLSDFSPDDFGVADVDWMKDIHLNAIQFYDWMYRHDQLLPPERQYTDPLGRHMDLKVIEEKIQHCKELGMRPIAYGAVYAATQETYEKHPEWGIYTMDGQPMIFAKWLYYMNISQGNGWVTHILEEYRNAIRFGFCGIHMDTYGFPKKVWDNCGHRVDLDKEFSGLINAAADMSQEEDDNGGVIFNAVNNWPVEAVAGSNQDSIYIEVWPPNDTYYDLYALIREARSYSRKNVILAAYMKPFLDEDMEAGERALRMTWATISASGGSQLVFGENHGLLRDSYYVNYAKLRPGFLPIVQKYCDFLVRYESLLYNDCGTDISKTASGGINEDICFNSDTCRFSTDGKSDTVWTIVRESEFRLTIHLINLKGNDCLWNEGKREPQQVQDIRINFRLDRPVRGFYFASPDRDSLTATELYYSCKHTEQGKIYTIKVPDVQYWTTIWVQLEE